MEIKMSVTKTSPSSNSGALPFDQSLKSSSSSAPSNTAKNLAQNLPTETIPELVDIENGFFRKATNFFKQKFPTKQNDDTVLWNQVVQNCANDLTFRKNFFVEFLKASRDKEKPPTFLNFKFSGCEAIKHVVVNFFKNPKINLDIQYYRLSNKQHIKKSGFIVRSQTVQDFTSSFNNNLWGGGIEKEIMQNNNKGINLKNNYLYFLTYGAGHALPLIIYEGKIISPVDFSRSKSDDVIKFIEESKFGKNFDSKVYTLPGEAFIIPGDKTKNIEDKEISPQATEYSCHALSASVLSRVADCVSKKQNPFIFIESKGIVLPNPVIYSSNQSDTWFKNYIKIFNNYVEKHQLETTHPKFLIENRKIYKSLPVDYAKDYMHYLSFKRLHKDDIPRIMEKLRKDFPDEMNAILKNPIALQDLHKPRNITAPPTPATPPQPQESSPPPST